MFSENKTYFELLPREKKLHVSIFISYLIFENIEHYLIIQFHDETQSNKITTAQVGTYL